MAVRVNVLRMLCVAVALMALCATASADLIFSEGFESPALSDPSAGSFVLGQAIGSSGTSGTLEVYGSGNYLSPFGVGAGSQYLVINAGGKLPDGAIWWDFTVGVGTYALSFDQTNFNLPSLSSQSLLVSVTQGATSLLADTFSNGATGYPSPIAHYSNTFTTTSSGTVRLKLTDTTSLYGSNGDSMVDNIQVDGPAVSTPEPGMLVLLATGLIGLLAYAWRKRR